MVYPDLDLMNLEIVYVILAVTRQKMPNGRVLVLDIFQKLLDPLGSNLELVLSTVPQFGWSTPPPREVTTHHSTEHVKFRLV